MYLAWLIPFMLFWVGLDYDTFMNWLITGTALEVVFTYPIAKMTAKYAPKITLYWQRMSDNSG